jgi:hypothetical protein
VEGGMARITTRKKKDSRQLNSSHWKCLAD